jgi:hypothetical protein
MRLRTQKEIVHQIYNGTPPPLLSQEGDVAAIKLGKGLTFEAATTIQYGGPDKDTVADPLSPPTQGPTAPDDAFATSVSKAPVAPAAGIGTSPETVITVANTRVPLPPPPKIPPLMSAQGKSVSKNSAPRSAFSTGGK